MDWQTAAASALVLACSARALWMFMPEALHVRLRRALGRPTARTASARGPCGGCNGCGTKAPTPGAAQPMKIVRQQPRA